MTAPYKLLFTKNCCKFSFTYKDGNIPHTRRSLNHKNISNVRKKKVFTISEDNMCNNTNKSWCETGPGRIKLNYNLTIMKSPNPATDNRFKWTLHCDKFWAWFFAVFWRPFWKWRPVEMLWYRESIQDIIIYLHMKCRWNRTMLNLCGIVVAILKMVISRNFSMSGINSGHHYLPTYQILMISDNVEFLPPIFYAVFWQPFWKWQISGKFWNAELLL